MRIPTSLVGFLDGLLAFGVGPGVRGSGKVGDPAVAEVGKVADHPAYDLVDLDRGGGNVQVGSIRLASTIGVSPLASRRRVRRFIRNEQRIRPSQRRESSSTRRTS